MPATFHCQEHLCPTRSVLIAPPVMDRLPRHHLTHVVTAGWRRVGASIGSAISASPATSLDLVLLTLAVTHHGFPARSFEKLFVASAHQLALPGLMSATIICCTSCGLSHTQLSLPDAKLSSASSPTLLTLKG